MGSSIESPVNLGNPYQECTMAELAHIIQGIVGTNSGVIYNTLPQDDPKKRRANITTANSRLGWEPKITIHEGLEKTVDYFKYILNQ